MELVQLGRTALSVSRLCLGTMNFGAKASENESVEVMNAAFDAGINFFDTADVYGWKEGEGWTECIVGRWLAKQSSRRDQIVLSTKVYGPMGAGANDRGLSAYHIRRACEASLRRLQTDHIDLYQLHHYDRSSSWDELSQALDVLVTQGKITYYGTSNFPAWQIALGQQQARIRGMLGAVSEQSRYNLMSRTAELEVIPCCRELGVAFLAWSPLAGGVLAGASDSSASGRRQSARTQSVITREESRLTRYFELCRRLRDEPASVALSWLLANRAVTAAVIGPRTRSQLETLIRASAMELDAGACASLDEIWPGPGEAPEAYAW